MTIVERVTAEGSRARRIVAATATTSAIAGATAVLLLGALLLGGGRWLTLPAAVPFVWWALAATATVFVVWWLPRRLAASATNEAVASAAEVERGLRRGALVGLVQVAPLNSTLIRYESQRLTKVVGTTALAPQHGRRLAMGAALALVTAVTAVIGTASTRSGLSDGWAALAHPVAAAQGKLLPALSLDQTPAAILRGDPLTAVVAAEGRRTVTVAWRVTGTAWRDTVLRVDDNQAHLALGAVDAPVTIVATDGRTSTDSLAVGVFERPFAGDVAVRAVYPVYLNIAAEVLSPDGALRLPEGTSVEIVARTAGLERVAITDSRDTIRFAIEAGRARARIVASTTASWQWIADAKTADLPSPLMLEVIADLAPNIEIISPSRDTLVSAKDDIRLVIAATDDHGLADVRLTMTRERGDGKKDGQDTTRFKNVSGERWMDELSIAMSVLDLTPGDAVILVAEAKDGAPWGRVGTSRRLVLRIPTADEQRDAANAAADSMVDRVGAAIAEQKGLEKRTADAARAGNTRADQKQTTTASEKAGAATFEAQERAKEVLADQRAMDQKTQELSKEAQRLSEELKKAGVLDSALDAQIREAERMLQEAMTPEMRKQLKELEERRGQMSAEELQEQLGKMQAPQKSMLEALEKSYEMLKRAALEGKMESLSDKAGEVAQQQKTFADSLQKMNAAERPQTAKELQQRAEQIQKEAKELVERLQKEQANAAKEGAQKAASEAQESVRKMQEALQKAMEQIGGQQPPPPPAGQQQQQQQQQQQTGGQQGQQQGQQSMQSAAQQASNAMQNASDAFSQARQNQVDSWKKDLTEALDRSIQETLQMARQQEQLKQQAQQGASQQQLRAEQGALQQGVQQTAERMSEQGQRSALVSPNSQRAMDAARQRVEQATRDVNEGATGQQAASTMQDAADALRQAAAAMARDRERAGSSQTASGLPEMMQQMREMANQQGQLNGQAASIMPTMGQASLGDPQKREELRKLAEKQRELAQKLEDAADADRTGKAEAMAREARQIAQQIERSALDPSVIDRQQRLFRRMLDAGRTLEQDGKDESDKREAKSGQGISADGPATGTARGAAATKFKEPTWDELRNLSPEDRKLIIDYFRRMNEPRRP